MATQRTDLPRASEAPADPSPVSRPSETAVLSDRVEHIRQAAYFLAERRDFAPGREMDDWLAAEHEVDSVAP